MIVPLSSDAGETIRSVCFRLAEMYASRSDRDVSALCMNLAADVYPDGSSFVFRGSNEDMHILAGILVTAGMSSGVSSFVLGHSADFGASRYKIRLAQEELSEFVPW